MLKEFKEFAMRGNVLDMAVGIVVGGAFGKITTSLVNDVLMPPVGLLSGEINFSNLFFNLSRHPYATLAEAQKAGAATINYGVFLNTVIEFALVSFAMFVLVRQVNRLRRVQEEPTLTTRNCPYCFTSIPAKATRCPHCTSQLGAN